MAASGDDGDGDIGDEGERAGDRDGDGAEGESGHGHGHEKGRGRGRKRKRADQEVPMPTDDDVALPPFEANIRRWAFSHDYDYDDAGRKCAGCEIVERRHAFVTAIDETRRRFEAGLHNVARSLTCREVRALSADYKQWADQEKERRALLARARGPQGPGVTVVHNMPDETFIDDWPDWQIIRHLFRHPCSLLARQLVRECLLRQNMDYAILNEMRRPTINVETGVVSMSAIVPATMAAVHKTIPLLRSLQEDISKQEQQLDADNGKAANAFAGTHMHGLFDLMGTIAF